MTVAAATPTDRVAITNTPSTPYLCQAGKDGHQLIVDGRPFLILGGELQNSSFSSSKFMEPLWPKLAAANLNTVLGSVSWEQIEPIEGKFDFRSLDENIYAARKHGLRLVLLWFGSFKNGMSTYAPSWVKQDAQRFPRAEILGDDGNLKTADVLSIFGTEAQEADALAFGALMKHLKIVDEAYRTVIMVQVENEIGLLGGSRDRSDLAAKHFRSPIPEDMLSLLLGDESRLTNKFQKHFGDVGTHALPADATWQELPADDDRINELFMAYFYCQYVETVASAGKRIYKLPLYTNVWQNYGDDDHDPNAPTDVGGGGKPGAYPCGGAVEDVLDVWQNFVPSLDFIAPDIYLNDYAKTCQKYCHRGQPLFIPEQRRDEYGARRMWHAFGSHNCLGVSPFGIDTLEVHENEVAPHYALLADVTHHILKAQTQPGSSIGFFFDEILPDGSDSSAPIEVVFGDWCLRIERSFVFGRPSPGSGMVIHQGADRFLLIGWGFQVSFTSRHSRAYFTGILAFKEQRVIDRHSGEMETLRLLNGDETRSGKTAIMPSQDPDYGGFPICVTVPANTGIAICEPYALTHR